MKPFNKFFPQKLLFLLLSTWVLLAVIPAGAQDGPPQTTPWDEPVGISPAEDWSWFPDMALDPYGVLHTIWCWTRPHPNTSGLIEQIKYVRLQGGAWENVNDIIPPSADIERNALAADLLGNLHITYGGSTYGNFEITYQHAPVADAWSAQEWSPPFRLNQGGGYNSDIAVSSNGTLHVVFDDLVYEENADLDDVILSDIYYRKSSDGGETWSWPRALQPHIETGSARPALLIDRNNTIHVTWDEGWDRLTGNQSEEYYSVYMSSSDGGETWSEPRTINYPDHQVAQLTVGSDNQRGVMLVWRSMDQAAIFYQWSGNQGQTWSQVQAIDGIFARDWMFPHDMYQMATDSDGRIHLFVAGRLSLERDTPVGIYHLIWNNGAWTAPIEVFARENLFPFYPKAAIQNGNEIHLAWFTKENNEWGEDVPRVIWYSRRTVNAPRQIASPWPTYTATPSPAPATRVPQATPTPVPDFNSIATPAPPGLIKPNPYTERDELAMLGLSLLPVALLLGGLFAIRWIRGKR
ncbi:MAG: exo-alpha-sialidase [Chloroflexota bacterium]